jgi:hypothetical protein
MSTAAMPHLNINGHTAVLDGYKVSHRVVNPDLTPLDAPAEIKIKPNFMNKLYRPLTLMEKLAYRFRCRSHSFTWPQTRQDAPLQLSYPWKPKSEEGEVSFNSHQICTCCGIQRFFDSKKWIPGDYFMWSDAGSRAERQQAPFDVLTFEESDFIEGVKNDIDEVTRAIVHG